MSITTPSPMLSALPDSPSPTGFNESTMSQPMWTDEIEYVELEKEDRGLGFSILDYKVSYRLLNIHRVQHNCLPLNSLLLLLGPSLS